MIIKLFVVIYQRLQIRQSFYSFYSVIFGTKPSLVIVDKYVVVTVINQSILDPRILTLIFNVSKPSPPEINNLRLQRVSCCFFSIKLSIVNIDSFLFLFIIIGC